MNGRVFRDEQGELDDVQISAGNISCSNCKLEYNNTDRKPRVLPSLVPCAHTFCEACLQGWIDARSAQGNCNCPIDRRVFPTANRRATDAPLNYELNRIVEARAKRLEDIASAKRATQQAAVAGTGPSAAIIEYFVRCMMHQRPSPMMRVLCTGQAAAVGVIVGAAAAALVQRRA